MNVIKADVLGFCMGVRRAVELAIAETENPGVKQVFTLGPLVHNPAVLSDLKKRGVKVIDELSPLFPHSSLVIRAHGISPEIELALRGNDLRIVDATCPKVKASQLKAKELASAGYRLFLAGEAHHAEIESILGYAKPAPFCTVTGSADEARNAAEGLYKLNSSAKTALLAQTTISQEEYKNIGDEIKKYFPNLEIIMSICTATKERQQALRKLLDKVDAVIVAGGKESANTLRLFKIAQESGKPAVLVENAEGIGEGFVKYKNIGLAAGASTPDSVIEEIENLLVSRGK